MRTLVSNGGRVTGSTSLMFASALIGGDGVGVDPMNWDCARASTSFPCKADCGFRKSLRKQLARLADDADDEPTRQASR
jgi:hypothetical protein